MESVEDVSEQLEPCEDETTVPTGPWEEDGNEDCPAYHTAAFRMYVMKILPCFKRYCHDWTICPFAHPGEKARRRDPRSAKYAGIACPEMKKAASCRRGNSCPYAHTVFEYWLHPSRYRTQLCKDGAGCQRRVCFFAHSLAELRASASKPSTQEALAGSQHNEEEMDAAGLGLFSAAAVPAQDQPGSPQSIISDGSPFGGLTTDASASASLKMGQPASSISVGSAQSLSLSSGSVSLSKAAASLSSQSRDPDRVSVSEVNDAVVSLKAAMMEGSADRNQVIDMLSTLLRGGPSASEGGSSTEAARQSAATTSSQPATEATHHRTASQPQLGQGSALQPPPPPPPHARRHSLAEATPRHRKARQADAQAQSMHSYSAAQRRLPPHVQAAMGTAPQQRKGGSQVPSSREGTREGPQQQAAGAKAGQQGDVWTRAALQHTAAAVQHLQALPQANHASASPHAHGTASVLAKTPERPSSVEGLWLGAGMSADSIAQPGWAAPVPDLAAQARETLYAMGQQQRLPVFPESEDSGELTERMRLLSMAHSQTTETLMRQNYSLQPLQRSASGPAPPVELQHPFLAAGSGSSSVPLPLPSLQQQQQQKQARQLDPASSYSLQPRVSRPAYPPVSTLRGQHFDSFGPGQHPVSLSERGACLDGGHHMEQVVSEPTYQSVAGAEGMPDSFTGYPVTGVLGQAENPMFAHGHSATEARVLRDWQDAGALRDFQASLARSLSYDQSGLLLQGGPAYQIDDPASGIMLGHLVAPSGQYGRDMQVPREAQAAVALKASAVGSPSSMYGYPPSEPGQPHMR